MQRPVQARPTSRAERPLAKAPKAPKPTKSSSPDALALGKTADELKVLKGTWSMEVAGSFSLTRLYIRDGLLEDGLLWQS